MKNNTTKLTGKQEFKKWVSIIVNIVVKVILYRLYDYFSWTYNNKCN